MSVSLYPRIMVFAGFRSTFVYQHTGIIDSSDVNGEGRRCLPFARTGIIYMRSTWSSKTSPTSPPLPPLSTACMENRGAKTTLSTAMNLIMNCNNRTPSPTRSSWRSGDMKSAYYYAVRWFHLPSAWNLHDACFLSLHTYVIRLLESTITVRAPRPVFCLVLLLVAYRPRRGNQLVTRFAACVRCTCAAVPWQASRERQVAVQHVRETECRQLVR